MELALKTSAMMTCMHVCIPANQTDLPFESYQPGQ